MEIENLLFKKGGNNNNDNDEKEKKPLLPKPWLNQSKPVMPPRKQECEKKHPPKKNRKK